MVLALSAEGAEDGATSCIIPDVNGEADAMLGEGEGGRGAEVAVLPRREGVREERRRDGRLTIMGCTALMPKAKGPTSSSDEMTNLLRPPELVDRSANPIDWMGTTHQGSHLIGH